MKLMIFKTTTQDNGWGRLQSFPSEWNSFFIHHSFDSAKKEIIKDFRIEYRYLGTHYYFVVPSFYKTETVTSISFNFFCKKMSFKEAMKTWKENKWRIDPDTIITYDIVDVDAIEAIE